MERLLELNDIALLPSAINNGREDKFDFGVVDKNDNSVSLPIFTSPVDSIINMSNWKVWEKSGIKPILPRTIPINIRLDGCQYLFAAFGINEIEDNFIKLGKRLSQFQFHVCIDCGNGHDVKLLDLCARLRQLYGRQINIMAGNIGNAKIYPEYCKVGIDYVRVGMTSGSLCISQDKYGFHIPLASLLMDVVGIKNTACIGLNQTKIIADGGIYSHADILKALALGADYVMCGRIFVKILEASGTVYRKIKTPEGGEILESVSPDIVKDTPLKELKLKRFYMGNTTDSALEKMGRDKNTTYVDAKSEWIEINSTLESWLMGLYDVFNYGFTMSGSRNWEEFKNNIRYGRVE